MIIIIEGVDGSGKTTLAAQLSKQNGYPVIHRTYPKNAAEKAAMMEEYISIIKSGKNFILDRCWYSEMAYGPVLRDEENFTYPQMYALEEMLAKKGAIIIYATGNIKDFWRACEARGEDYVQSYEILEAVHTKYEEIMSAPHYIPVVRYEYKNL